MCYSPLTVLNPAFRSEKYRGNRRRPSPDPDNFPDRVYRVPLSEARATLSEADFITESTKHYIQVPCGWCASCRKARGSSWRFRLTQDLTKAPKGTTCIFVTLTFSTRHYGGREKAVEKCATRLRAFLDRWRKKYGKTPRHWFVTELGEKKGRFHLHGFIWDAPFYIEEKCDPYRSLTKMNRLLRSLWKYGSTYVGYIVPKHVNYVTKYVVKPPEYDKLFRSRIFCSAGIGSFMGDECVYRFYSSAQNVNNHYKVDFYGKPTTVPKYYRDRVFRRLAKEAGRDVAPIVYDRRYVAIRAPETGYTIDGICFPDRQSLDRYLEARCDFSRRMGLYPPHLLRRLFPRECAVTALHDRAEALMQMRDMSDIDNLFKIS